MSLALAANIGAVIDQVFGEPPVSVHPVARFGTAMQRIETRTYADRRLNGVAHLAVGCGLAISTGFIAKRLLGSTVSAVAATAFCAAGKMLDDEALTIADLIETDQIESARARVRSLIGRNSDALNASELSRGVVESLAENSVDAVTASLFWGSVGGAPMVLAHRAINTLDAMVGHRNARYQRFGWASARLDDVVNFIPARLGAVGVSLVRPMRARAVFGTIRRDARLHPSPNGGVIEAAFAGALGVRLGGTNVYGDRVEHRGVLGTGSDPTPADIRAAVTLRRQSTIAVGLTIVAAQMIANSVLQMIRQRRTTI